jgi:hypothetical protein
MVDHSSRAPWTVVLAVTERRDVEPSVNFNIGLTLAVPPEHKESVRLQVRSKCFFLLPFFHIYLCFPHLSLFSTFIFVFHIYLCFPHLSLFSRAK